MKKNILVIDITILFLFVSLVPLSQGLVNKEFNLKVSNGNTFYVGGIGTGNYSKIQDAIDNASDGNTVFVFDESSPYYENIVLNKSLNLVGEDRETTIIDSYGRGHVVHINQDFVSICGFTIQNTYPEHAFQYGLYVTSDNNVISNNIIRRNKHQSIVLWKSSNNIVRNNFISKGNSYGINVQLFSHNNTIIQNTIFDGPNHGICLSDDSKYNIISNNTIDSNGGCGIIFSGGGNWYCKISGNEITNNGKEGIYIWYNSSHTIISNNFIDNNSGMGILIDLWCHYTNISGNIISRNNQKYHNDIGGIGIGSSYLNVISRNEILNNKREGLYLYESNYNKVLENNFYCWDDPAFFEFEVSGSFKNVLKSYFLSSYNNFKENYWGKPRIFPKPIKGKILQNNWGGPPWAEPRKLPALIFDWHPAKKPYNIGV